MTLALENKIAPACSSVAEGAPSFSLRGLRFVSLVSMKISILVALLLSSVAFADEQKPASAEVAVIKTNQGDMVVQFWTDAAPETIANFKKLARSGFYNGTTFHRVV